MAPRQTEITNRFWAKVQKSGPIPEHRPDLGECWRWLPAKDWNSYGIFWMGPVVKRYIAANRAALIISEYESTGAWPDPIPMGWDRVAEHLCRTPACVNPKHLEWTTQQENVNRGALAIVNRLKADAITHCKQGHELTPENKIFNGPNWRCRICKEQGAKERGLRRRARQKAIIEAAELDELRSRPA